MKLDECLVCLDCDAVFSVNDKTVGACCPDCGSCAAVALWTWLPSMNEDSMKKWLERRERIDAQIERQEALVA